MNIIKYIELSVFVINQQIDCNYPFYIVEVIQPFEKEHKYKIRWIDKNIAIIKDRYNIMKEYIQNPLIIMNCHLFDIEININKIL